jgi:hypothetical protein
MRALGEPSGSRRLTDEQHDVEPDAAPPAEESRPSAVPGRSREGDDRTADERTSPFPYAENFDEWVADETAASDGREGREPPDPDA